MGCNRCQRSLGEPQGEFSFLCEGQGALELPVQPKMQLTLFAKCEEQGQGIFPGE